MSAKLEDANTIPQTAKSNSGTSGKKIKGVNYNKWGYFFILPFFLVYIIFQLIPLVSTFRYSFYEHYISQGLLSEEVIHRFVGIENYKTVFTDKETWRTLGNTMIMWLMGFVPQIIISLLFASWFTDLRLRLKATGLFKTVIYMPNLIMASAFSMLFFALFSPNGPVNDILIHAGIIKESFRFFSHAGATRGLVALMNFLMWFGNTTILLMAAIMGIDPSLYESAQIDGASSGQIFRSITLPLIRPILVYVVITSMIGGLQMFDVPQILTDGTGSPYGTTKTMVMNLNEHLYSKNYGMAGTISVLLFVLSAILSIAVFLITIRPDTSEVKKKKSKSK